MTAMYVVMALANWSPPTMFESGPNGIASDDIVTGILVMGGGVLVLVAFLLGRTLIRRPTRLAAAWAWVLSFATVVVAGYAIEMNEAFFGAGDPSTAGAANDAIFTWLHQDIGLFLLPAIVLVMLAAELLVDRRKPLSWIGWSTIVGITARFRGWSGLRLCNSNHVWSRLHYHHAGLTGCRLCAADNLMVGSNWKHTTTN